MKRKTKRILITTSVSLLCLVLGYIIAYYLYGIRLVGEVRKELEGELNLYKLDFNQSCYLLTRDVREGDEVKREDFTVQLIPEDLYNEGLIIDIEEVEGAKYSRDFLKKTIAYQDMFYQLKDIQGDLRRYELGAITLSERAEINDYVDVRINFPSGLDYVVLSKKRIEDLSFEGEEKIEAESKVLCTFFLTSEEILRLSSALVDAYLTEGAFLYTTTYVAPTNQEGAKITYPSNEAVQELMAADPNVIQKAIVELESSKRKLLNRSLISYNENEQLQLISTLKEGEGGEASKDKEDADENKEKSKDKEAATETKKKKEEKIDTRDSNSID